MDESGFSGVDGQISRGSSVPATISWMASISDFGAVKWTVPVLCTTWLEMLPIFYQSLDLEKNAEQEPPGRAGV
jgi:hypothetical protein